MAQPTTAPGTKFLILIGNGATPEVFGEPCGLTTKGMATTAASNDILTALDKQPNDLDPKLWGMNAIHAPQAWETETGTRQGPVVAVIDGGVDYTHPELAANVWTNPAGGDWNNGRSDYPFGTEPGPLRKHFCWGRAYVQRLGPLSERRWPVYPELLEWRLWGGEPELHRDG